MLADLLFLGFIAATSSFSGCWATCGCSVPCIDAQVLHLATASGPRGIMRSTAFSMTRSGKRPSRQLARRCAP